METATQVAIGVGLGVLANRIMSTREKGMTPNRSRRKKFVRVRGHMRCMPKRCKCEQKAEPVEKKQEKSALSLNEVPKTVVESVPFRPEDWPTMSDVTKEPRVIDEEKIDVRAIPWKKVAMIGVIILLGVYLSKEAQKAQGAK